MALNFNINTLDEAEALAEVIADNLDDGVALLLRGNLGAGKTTFTQFIGKHLGVRRRMTSPTFNIIKSYPLDGKMIHHMDCYRLEHSEEDLGFDEYFNGRDIVLIEWPDFISEFLPDEHMDITISAVDEERVYTIEDYGNYSNLTGALYDYSID